MQHSLAEAMALDPELYGMRRSGRERRETELLVTTVEPEPVVKRPRGRPRRVQPVKSEYDDDNEEDGDDDDGGWAGTDRAPARRAVGRPKGRKNWAPFKRCVGLGQTRLACSPRLRGQAPPWK